MFKLIKIQNSGVNVPELITLKKDEDTVFPAGVALVMKNGLINICDIDTKPTHISFGCGKAGKSEAVCFEIYGNMFFETELSDDIGDLKVGSNADLDTDPDGYVSFVSTANPSGFVRVCDTCGAKHIGNKIVVKFN